MVHEDTLRDQTMMSERRAGRGRKGREGGRDRGRQSEICIFPPLLSYPITTGGKGHGNAHDLNSSEFGICIQKYAHKMGTRMTIPYDPRRCSPPKNTSTKMCIFIGPCITPHFAFPLSRFQTGQRARENRRIGESQRRKIPFDPTVSLASFSLHLSVARYNGLIPLLFVVGPVAMRTTHL